MEYATRCALSAPQRGPGLRGLNAEAGNERIEDRRGTGASANSESRNRSKSTTHWIVLRRGQRRGGDARAMRRRGFDKGPNALATMVGAERAGDHRRACGMTVRRLRCHGMAMSHARGATGRTHCLRHRAADVARRGKRLDAHQQQNQCRECSFTNHLTPKYSLHLRCANPADAQRDTSLRPP